MCSDFSGVLNVYGLSCSLRAEWTADGVCLLLLAEWTADGVCLLLLAEWTADGVCLLLLKELHQFDEDFVCEEKTAGGETEVRGGAFQQL